MKPAKVTKNAPAKAAKIKAAKKAQPPAQKAAEPAIRPSAATESPSEPPAPTPTKTEPAPAPTTSEFTSTAKKIEPAPPASPEAAPEPPTKAPKIVPIEETANRATDIAPAERDLEKATNKAPSKATKRPPTTVPEPEIAQPTFDEPTKVLQALRTYPGYAAEILALAAVEHLGREADRYATWVRVTYPNTTPDGLARLATQRFLRLARTEGALAGAAGPFTLLLEASGLAWLQARLVLHVAAAYGRDPEDRARAGELLMLQRVHPSLQAAQSALDAVQRPTAAPGVLTPRVATPVARAIGVAALRAGLARLAGRLIPGGGAVVGAVSAVRSTERLAIRATSYYKGERHLRQERETTSYKNN